MSIHRSIDKLKNLGFDRKRMRFFGGDDKEEAPAPPPRPSYESLIPQRAKDIEGDLYSFGKGRLDPSYQAISPEKQAMMYQRIQDQLSPAFEKSIKDQEQGIFSQGITGTPGAAILGKLRQDYMKDLMGKATDIAIEDIGLTESGRRYGAGLLDNLRGSLMNQANMEYQGAMGDRNMQYAANMNEYNQDRAEDTAFWSGMGGLAGSIGSSLIPFAGSTFFSPSSVGRSSKGVGDMLGGGSSFMPDFNSRVSKNFGGF